MKRIKLLLVLFFSLSVVNASVGADEPTSGIPLTLLQMAGVKAAPPRLSESVLLIIDAQREYLDGKLPLKGIEASLTEAKAVLERARKAGIPVIHVVHKGKPSGALFNPETPCVDIVGALEPKPDEMIIAKNLPNAFAGTDLEQQLSRLGRKNLIVMGYMTHMCVSATVRAALDKGYRSTVVAQATATRDLPDNTGGVIPAQDVQRSSLAALADRFAVVVQSACDLVE